MPARWRVLIPHCRDLDLGDRLPEFIHNTSRYHTAAWQREVDALEGLAIEDLKRFAGLERPELTVLQAHVDAFRGREVVAPGRQLLEFVASTGIRRDETAFRELRTAGADIGHDADLRVSVGGSPLSPGTTRPPTVAVPDLAC